MNCAHAGVMTGMIGSAGSNPSWANCRRVPVPCSGSSSHHRMVVPAHHGGNACVRRARERFRDLGERDAELAAVVARRALHRLRPPAGDPVGGRQRPEHRRPVGIDVELHAHRVVAHAMGLLVAVLVVGNVADAPAYFNPD
jgi:hypothetical protein